MAPIGKIYGPVPHGWYSKKIDAVCNIAGVSVEYTPEFEHFKDNQTEEFLSKFPLGKVPAFEGKINLFECEAICQYLAAQNPGCGLLGATPEESAEITQFMQLCGGEIMPNVRGLARPILGKGPFIKPAAQQFEEGLNRAVKALDRLLENRTFLVGERLTLADVVATGDLRMYFIWFSDAEMRKEVANVTRYFTTMIHQKGIREAMGAVEFAAEVKRYVPPAKEAKKKEPKAPKAPKAAKPAKKAEEDDELAMPAPKPRSKLDLLPPTTFNLEDWKRFYSNNETKPDAMAYFWQHLDAAGFTLWKATYKYNDELTQVYMSNNLIGGFFNRLDRARKYAFGVMVVMGEDHNNEIAGYFVIRGNEVPEEVTDAADFESYDFVKADHTDPKTKQEIEDYFAWEGPSLPRPVADGKVFK